MECPQCKQVSPASMHCVYCGWDEPITGADQPDCDASLKQTPSGVEPEKKAPNEKVEKNAQSVSSSSESQAESNPESKPQSEAEPKERKRVSNDSDDEPPGIRHRQRQRFEGEVSKQAAKKGPARVEVRKAAGTPKPEAKPGDSPEVEAKPASPPQQLEAAGIEVPAQGVGEPGNEIRKSSDAVAPEQTPLADETHSRPLEPGKRVSSPKESRKDKKTIEKIGQYNIVRGKRNFFAQKLVLVQGTEERVSQDEKSFVDFTTELPRSTGGALTFVSKDLEARSTLLKQENLILISCMDHGVAQAAAYAIVETLDVQLERRRLLNFERLTGEDSELSIYLFLKKKLDSEGQTAIVVDAINDKAQKFLDSLFSEDGMSNRDIKEDLERSAVLLVCLVDSEKMEKRLRDRKQDLQFAYWRIPFLEHLLRSCFPDRHVALRTRILEQQSRGKWSSEEGEFYRQIRGGLRDNLLPGIVEQDGISSEPVRDAPRFDDVDPVQNIVLYVGAFFEGLSPMEFDRVVSALLGDKMTDMAVMVNQKAEDGTVKQVEVVKKKALIELWRESSDRILKKCHLITAGDTLKAITFSDAAFKDRLRSHLEEQYGLYLQNRFVDLLESGLLFDSSERIAKNFIRLFADLAASYPDYFGTECLFDVVTKLRTHFDRSDREAPRSTGQRLQLLGSAGGIRTKAQAYKRLAGELMREMLVSPELVRVVEGVMEELMTAGYFDSVLEVVKQLRFAPNFDKFSWMRQLLDRGDESIRLQTYAYLYGEVKKMGLQVYQILDVVKEWLPAVDRDLQRYAPSNRLALRLMIEYCLETTSGSDSTNYGAWRTYPLLAVKTEEAAKDSFDLLITWLLHPGMKCVVDDQDFDEDFDRLLPALVSEWVFILLGQPDRSNGSAESPDSSGNDHDSVEGDLAEGPVTRESAANIAADQVLRILLEQLIVKSGNFPQSGIQQTMLTYWEEMKDLLPFVIDVFGYDRKQRKEFIWKRNLIRDLLAQFRSLQRQYRTARVHNVST